MAGGRPNAVSCLLYKATRKGLTPIMTEERPRRQRTAQSKSEFCRGGLLHTEELQLRRALYASLKEVKISYNRKRRLREPRKNPDTFNKPITKDFNSTTKSKIIEKEVKDAKSFCRSRRGETALNGLPKKVSEHVKDEEKTSTKESREKKGGKPAVQDSATSLGLVERRKCLGSVEGITKEKTSSASDDCISESSFQAPAINRLHRKLKRRTRHKTPGKRQVANDATKEMYFPANLGKTEDFLTFLCLRGNSSLPRTFEMFNHPSHFCTPASLSIDDTALLCPTFPSQSSITYSPPLSGIPSDSSGASPMSSADSWSLSDE